jgi:hypothetical protein
MLEGGIYEFLWLGDNDVTLSMVKRGYQKFQHGVRAGYLHNNLTTGSKIATTTPCSCNTLTNLLSIVPKTLGIILSRSSVPYPIVPPETLIVLVAVLVSVKYWTKFWFS